MLIAITGSIGSGKSALIEYLNHTKRNTFSFDDYIKTLYQPSSPIFSNLIELLKDFYRPEDMTFDYQAIRKAIIISEPLDRKLKMLLFPLVNEKLKQLKEEYHNDCLFIEIPLVYESRSDLLVDYIIYVDANPTIIEERLIKRGHIDSQEKKALEKLMLPPGIRKERADFVIDNSASTKVLADQFEEIFLEIKK